MESHTPSQTPAPTKFHEPTEPGIELHPRFKDEKMHMIRSITLALTLYVIICDNIMIFYVRTKV